MLAVRAPLGVAVLLAVIDAAAPDGVHLPLGGLLGTSVGPLRSSRAEFGCALPVCRLLGFLGHWLQKRATRYSAEATVAAGKSQRSRREAPPHHHPPQHEPEMDANFVHLPEVVLDHLPDGEQACEALKNASVLQQVLPVVVEPPCPVTLRPLLAPQRVWPRHLLAALCSCPKASCRARSAFVCTQVFSPVVVVTLAADGVLSQHRQLVAAGCRCMAARATLADDDDLK